LHCLATIRSIEKFWKTTERKQFTGIVMKIVQTKFQRCKQSLGNSSDKKLLPLPDAKDIFCGIFI